MTADRVTATAATDLTARCLNTLAPCTVPDCEKPVQARGWCSTHYQAARRAGLIPPRSRRDVDDDVDRRGGTHNVHRARDLPPLTSADIARFLRRVDKQGDCWLWTGTPLSAGYARMSIGRRSFAVHRLTFAVHGIPLDPCLSVDHLCRTKLCVRPSHLQPVSQSTNSARQRLMSQYAASEICSRGHALTHDNTYWYRRPTGAMNARCRACHAAQMRRQRANGRTP